MGNLKVTIDDKGFDLDDQLLEAEHSPSQIFSDYVLTEIPVFEEDTCRWRLFPLERDSFDCSCGDCIKANPFTIRTFKRFSARYISEILLPSVVNLWKTGSSTLINAQTASGKSTFVLETLPKLIKHDEYILLIVPRIALKSQYLLNIGKHYGENFLDKYTISGLGDVNQYKNFLIFTYQELALSDQKMRLLSDHRHQTRFCVIDEVHLLVADSGFNPYTHSVFERLLSLLHDTTRIYLSATPEKAIQAIYSTEATVKNRPVENHNLYPPDHFGPSLTIYSFHRDYHFLNVRFFSNTDSLINVIGAAQGKTIIFVESILHGTELKEKLLRTGKTVSFLTAESRTKEKAAEYMQLLTKGLLCSDILIVTRWLDVGVNVEDPAVQNIVTFHINGQDVIQMLGRKRINKHEQVQLYQFLPNRENVENRLASLYADRAIFCENLTYYKRGCRFTELRPGFFAEHIAGLSCSIHPNPLYLYQLDTQIKYLQSLNTADFCENFRQTVISWFPGCHLPSEDSTTDLSEEENITRAQIIKYIEQHSGMYDRKEFCRLCNHIVIDICGRPRRTNQTDSIPMKELKQILDTYSIPFEYAFQDGIGCFKKQEDLT